MFRKKVKKAFTLVELLVVIAILAILATVSVVGYMQFTKRAQQSNDMSLTTQINTVLQADEVTGAPEYPSEAIAVMEEAGANIADLSPTTEGYSYVYNLKTNRVILLDGDKKVVAPADATIDNPADCYAMVHSEEEKEDWVEAGYSVYLSSKFTGSTVAVNKAVGVDVGESNVTSVSITGSEQNTITVYTKDGTFAVNAGGATVNHYGQLNTADIQSVAMHSYYEYGRVIGTLTLSSGSVKAQAGSSVAYVITPETVSDAATVSVAVEETANVAYVVVPEGVKSSVSAENAEIVTSTAETPLTKFAGGLGTVESPYLISNAEQFANIADTTISGSYFKLTGDLSIATAIPMSQTGITNINFGGYKLETNYQNTTSLSNGVSLTLSNGALYYRGASNIVQTCFEIKTGSSIKLDGVDFTTPATGLYPWGNAATVEVVNSKISAGVYCVATNAATVENWNVKIVLQNSEFYASNTEYNSSLPVMINVPGTLTMENCVVTGQQHVVLIRGGTAAISNCTLNFLEGDGSDDIYLNKDWESGNGVAPAGLVVGNRSNAYQYAANCTVSNVTINVPTGKIQVCMAGNSGEGIGASLNFSGGNFGLENIIVLNENCTINGSPATVTE